MFDHPLDKLQLIEYLDKTNPKTILIYFCRSKYLTYKEHFKVVQKEESKK